MHVILGMTHLHDNRWGKSAVFAVVYQVRWLVIHIAVYSFSAVV